MGRRKQKIPERGKEGREVMEGGGRCVGRRREGGHRKQALACG